MGRSATAPAGDHMSTMTRVHHPIFARMYRRLAAEYEDKGASEHRDEMLDAVSGRVIEVGAGTGLNFAHYPSSVTEVVAVEPESYLRAAAEDAARTASVPVQVVDGLADALPSGDGAFDAGVASLVLCSVPTPTTALGELFRVIRPGGELRFCEHVRSESPVLARMQRALDVVWPWFGGGCHTSRDTEQAITEAGFVIERIRRFTFRPVVCAAPVAPIVVGTARRP
jgi:ubiquinone/menaquinone biosynthesis C-methylase UbiE